MTGNPGPGFCVHRNQLKRSVDQSVVIESLINEPLDDIHDVRLGAVGRFDMPPMCRRYACVWHVPTVYPDFPLKISESHRIAKGNPHVRFEGECQTTGV